MNDLRFAFRQLLKNPGFTVRPSQCCYGGQAVAVLTLALGIAASSAIFMMIETQAFAPMKPPVR